MIIKVPLLNVNPIDIAGFNIPLPKNSDKIINMLKPIPITTPVSGWEIGQSFPSLAQLEIKIKNKEVKINSVIKVEPKWKLLSTSILSKRKKLFFKAITEKNAPIIWADM